MPCNKSIKFVPAFGLHRTPLSGRRLFQRYTQGMFIDHGKESRPRWAD